jgi:hypothetical protein
MRFKVPQNVQREDQILWFITLKQMVMLIIGIGLSYLMFVKFNKTHDLNQAEQIMLWIPAAIAVAFAFVKIQGLPLVQFVLLMVESLLFRSPRRYFQSGQNVAVPIYTTIKMEDDKSEEVLEKKNLSVDEIQDLANIVDGK